MTTAGGWGVVTADAITRDRDLVLLPLPDDLRAEIDTKLPPRWSRSNPVDLAGGETARHDPRRDGDRSPATPTCTPSSTWASASRPTRPAC